MIRSFRSKCAEDIYHGTPSRQSRRLPKELYEKARRLLDQLNAATALDTMRVPPGNRLEKLRGDLNGFYSVRINDQWRIIFRWSEQGADEVDIVDYHS